MSITFFLCPDASYENLSTLCPQAEPQVPLDIPTVCPGRRKSSETGLIIAVVLFVLGIFACIGVLLAVFCSRNESDGGHQQQKQQKQQKQTGCLVIKKGGDPKEGIKKRKQHQSLNLKASPQLITKRQSSLSSTLNLNLSKSGFPSKDSGLVGSGGSLGKGRSSVKSFSASSSTQKQTLKQQAKLSSKKELVGVVKQS